MVIECTVAEPVAAAPRSENIFKILDEILEPDAIIATNGPTVIISEWAADLVHGSAFKPVFLSPTPTPYLEIVKGCIHRRVYKKWRSSLNRSTTGLTLD